MQQESAGATLSHGTHRQRVECDAMRDGTVGLGTGELRAASTNKVQAVRARHAAASTHTVAIGVTVSPITSASCTTSPHIGIHIRRARGSRDRPKQGFTPAPGAAEIEDIPGTVGNG